MTLRVAIVDDQELMRTGFRMIVEAEPDLTVVGEAGNGPDGIELCRRLDPDVVLMRVTGRQLMVLSDGLPELSFEGKPQCHIVAMAKEHGVAAASVG